MRKVLLILFAAICAAASWAEDVVTATYTSSKIDVALVNTTEFVAFQMDIKAEGVDLTGKTVTLKDARLNQTGTATIGGSSVNAPFVLASNVLSDGTLRVIAYNLANRSISLTEGSLFEVAVDNKPTEVTLSNVLFVKASDLAELAVAANAVPGADFVVGDVDGNGEINLFDLLAIVDFLLGNDVSAYSREAANVNGDAEGIINLFDLTALAELLMNQ